VQESKCSGCIFSKQGILITSYLLQRKLEQKGLNQEQIESFVENMDIHCFKSDLKAEEFISIINKICIISDNLGIPVDDMPEYMSQEEERLKEIRQDITDLQMAKLKYYKITM
jgi:hypothetical protein